MGEHYFIIRIFIRVFGNLRTDVQLIRSIIFVLGIDEQDRSLLNVKVCRGADIGSDHFLVRGFLSIKLRTYSMRKSIRTSTVAVERLMDHEDRDKYQQELLCVFENTKYGPEAHVNEMWAKFKEKEEQEEKPSI